MIENIQQRIAEEQKHEPLAAIMKNIIIPGLILLIVSCKSPVPDFETDKNEYSAGDVVHITNQSSHSGSYSWNFQSNSIYGSTPSKTSNDKSPSDTINMMTEDGTHDIVLTAYSRNNHKGKNTQITKSFFLKTLRGGLIIQATSGYSGVTVTADRQKIGVMNYGYLNVSIPIGVRLLELSGPNGKKTQTIHIIENSYSTWTIQ